MTRLIDRAEAVRIVNRIWGCSDHDQPNQCADCDIRHKALRALASLPVVEPVVPDAARIEAAARDQF